MARRLASSMALAATVLLVAAPAYAGVTRVSWPTGIVAKAAPGTHNDVRMYYQDFGQGDFSNVLYDTAGVTTHVTEPPSCYPMSRAAANHPWNGKAVFCPDGTSLGGPGDGQDLSVFLGDQNDRFNALEALGQYLVHGGAGADRLVGGNEPVVMFDFDINRTCGYFTQDTLVGDGGNDRLYGRLGDDYLTGGGGNDYLVGGKDQPAKPPGGEYCTGFGERVGDTLLGGSGKDKIVARDGQRDLAIDCGPGKDKAYLDKKDPKPKRCEKVKRS
jgi:Ca2+-binding RTX toxin-like protein